jgi:hypothetical protein
MSERRFAAARYGVKTTHRCMYRWRERGLS